MFAVCCFCVWLKLCAWTLHKTAHMQLPSLLWSMLLDRWRNSRGINTCSCWFTKGIVWPCVSLFTSRLHQQQGRDWSPHQNFRILHRQQSAPSLKTWMQNWYMFSCMNWIAADASEGANAGIHMPPYQLSSQHVQNGSAASFSEKCWVSRGCAIDIWPGSIALASQPPLKSDKRSECRMVIFYWRGLRLEWWGHGGM